jgi:hypothetical protein
MIDVPVIGDVHKPSSVHFTSPKLSLLLLLQVDKDGNGYWALRGNKVAKTNGNAGSASMVRAHESF